MEQLDSKSLRGGVKRMPTTAVVWNVAVILALLMWSSVVAFGGYPGAQDGALLLLVTVALSGMAIFYTHKEGQWSMPFLSFVALALFHVGLFLSLALFGTTPAFLVDSDATWFLAADLGVVSALLSLGFLGLALGSTLPVLIWSRQRLALEEFHQERPRAERQAIADVGSAVLIVSVGLWFYSNIQLNGFFFFLGSYRAYLDAVEGSLVGTSFIGIGLGLTLCVQSLRGWLSRLGLVAFALFAAAGFPLGLRGEVLMPLVAATGVFMKMAGKRPRWLLVAGSAIVLVLITIGRQIRALGVSAVGDAEVSVRIFDAIEEMGASMRVLATTVHWHMFGGEPYAMGATYLTPMLRNVRSVVGLPNPPAGGDFGLFNIAISERVGNIGGSVIGEAHHNFGAIGIVFVLAAWGFAIASINRVAMTPWGVLVLGAVGMMFLMHVRNASTPLFIWGMVALGMYGVAHILARSRLHSKKVGKGATH